MSGFGGSPVVGYVRSAVRADAMLDAHVAELQRFAADHGLNLATVIRDEGTSAVAAWRPVFDALLAELQRGQYVGVLIPSLTHLGRPTSAALRSLERLRATSAWVSFLDDQGVPEL